MKILIVDDSKAMRMMVSSNLKQAGYRGHTIIEAENGALGLQMVMDQQPDLVLSDWNMPEMTGMELLKTLKEHHESKQIPKMPTFVFVTSESTTEMLEQALTSGAQCLITKPFSAEIFEQKLANIIK